MDEHRQEEHEQEGRKTGNWNGDERRHGPSGDYKGDERRKAEAANDMYGGKPPIGDSDADEQEGR